jgi:hypothetical protein
VMALDRARVEGTKMHSDSEGEEEQDGSADEFGKDELTLTREGCGF